MKFDSYDIRLAQELDAEDPLKKYRSLFYIDDPDTIYLDGNSLGRLPVETVEKIGHVVTHEWGQRLIRSWNENWLDRSRSIAAKIAQLVGADADEIWVGDSTSVNLYKLVTAALVYQKNRTKIISDKSNFPSDLYVIQGIIKKLNKNHELKLLDGPAENDPAKLNNEVDDNSALVTLSHVAFKNAYRYNMKTVTELAQKKNALVLWDLSHSAGAVPIELNNANVDLAIGCTYKYLNGGPGSPAFLYVRKDLQEKLYSPIQGWFGADKPFDFKLDYQPAHGIQRFAAGTPGILSMSSLETSLKIHLQAGMENIYKKSIRQSDYLLFLAHEWLLPLGFKIASPENSNERGSHIALKHPQAFQICQALIKARPPLPKVIPDFRAPDIIRLGIAPLYVSFVDIYRALDCVKDIVQAKRFMEYPEQRNGVT